MKSNVAQDKKNKKKERDRDETNSSHKKTSSKKISSRANKSSASNDPDVTQKSSAASGKKSTRRKSARKKSLKFLMWIKFGFAAAVILVLVFAALFDVSRVTSNAMMPALSRGDLVLSWAPVLISKNFHDGDIVLVKQRRDSEPNYLRLIASHDEIVDYSDDEISVNGSRLSRLRLTSDAIVRPDDEPEIWRETLPSGVRYRIMLPQQAVVGDLNGSVCADQGAFLVGDNRMASYDSRQNGLYDDSRLLGQALIVLETVRRDGVIGPWIKWVD